MTKEQEEAIEIINKMIKSYKEANECGLSNNDFKHEIKAMQTIISILKEKDKEIENLEEEKNNAWEEWNNLEQNSYEEEKRLKAKVEQKDRQINSKNGTINALKCALKERTDERDRKDDVIKKKDKIIKLLIDRMHLNYNKIFGTNEIQEMKKIYDEIKNKINLSGIELRKECIKQYFESMVKDNDN